jgi:hypothetical protein
MKTTAIMAVAMAPTAAAIGLAAPTHADVVYQFSQPGGNVDCMMATRNGDQAWAGCQIHQFSYQPPPPTNCPVGGWGHTFRLDQGNPGFLACNSGVLVSPKPAPLDWEQTRTVGALDCQNSNANPSVPPSTLCRDNSTGHYFRIYSDHYELG